MAVVTTRRVAELRAQCDALGIPYATVGGEAASREVLMDLLRERLGAFDKDLELDPMKARDLNGEIDWSDVSGSIGSWLGPGRTMQPKLDGVRLRLFMGLSSNSMNSGRRSVKTFAYTRRDDNFPLLRDAVVPELAGTVLDGELLAPTGQIQSHTGTWTNSLLNASVALTNSNAADSVRTQQRFGWATLHVFDVMMLGGEDVSVWPFRRRYEMLEAAFERIVGDYPGCPIKLVPNWPSSEESLLRALEEGYEGVVIKLDSSTYAYGQRNGGGPPRGNGKRPTAGWAKVKQTATADAFICGYSPGENANEGLVGSLNLAVYAKADLIDRILPVSHVEIDGEVYVERPVAQVGNLTAELRREMTDEDGSLKGEWYGKVVEFKAQALGKNGRARHAGMLRLRPDKVAADCLEEQLDAFARA